MEKEEIIQTLEAKMTAIHKAYYGDGACVDLLVHRSGESGISIDLYNARGDGEPVCEGLTWEGKCPHCGKISTLRAFCLCYNPGWKQPLCVLCFEDSGDCDDWDSSPRGLPESVLKSIVNWLKK